MASQKPFFVGFMLVVLCMHHCSARKVLLDVDDHPKQVDLLDTNDVSTQGGIGVDCGSSGCNSGGIPCYEQPCRPPFEVIVPTPPLVVPVPPHYIPIPPYVVPTPCTPCEPWYGPEPCPCPCEEDVGKDGVKTEGHLSGNMQQEGEKVHKESHELGSNNGKVAEVGLTDKMAMAQPPNGDGANVDGAGRLHV